jgi:hypothetical protein
MLGSSNRVATDDPSVWHGRFAHLSHGTLCKIARHCTGIPRLPHQPQEPCIACVKAKMQQRALSSLPAAPPHVALRPLDALAIDLFGRLPASLSEKDQNTILDDIASQEPTSFAATASSTRPRPSPRGQARARDSPAAKRPCASSPLLLFDTCSSQHVTGDPDALYDVRDIKKTCVRSASPRSRARAQRASTSQLGTRPALCPRVGRLKATSRR